MSVDRIRETNPGLDIFLESHPENAICADCGTKVPRWASVSLGIFICTNCAGIHRKLGVHISFVQSCTMDKWKPEWIEKFSKMGNKIAKMYYEHGITPRYLTLYWLLSEFGLIGVTRYLKKGAVDDFRAPSVVQPQIH